MRQNLVCWNPPCLLSAPEPSRSLYQPSAPEGSGTLRNLLGNLVLQLDWIAPKLFWAKKHHSKFCCYGKKKKNDALSPTAWKILESFWPSAREVSGTLSAISTGTLQNLISHLRQNLPEPHQPSAPEPSASSPVCPGTLRTSQAISTRTLRNLISHLPGTLRNLISYLSRSSPEPHQPSAPEPSGISSAICTGTLRNPPEPGIAAAPDRTRAPYKFCCWRIKNNQRIYLIFKTWWKKSNWFACTENCGFKLQLTCSSRRPWSASASSNKAHPRRSSSAWLIDWKSQNFILPFFLIRNLTLDVFCLVFRNNPPLWEYCVWFLYKKPPL